MAVDQTNPPGEAALAWEALLDLGPGPGPRVARLERAVRDAVRAGRAPVGAALPPSRQLAETLGVSRWVVTEAYGQLVAEGALESRTGSGTRVPLTARTGTRATGPGARATPSGTGGLPAPRARLDLGPGVPDLRHVPRAAWVRALREALAEAPDADLAAPDPTGHPATRAALADYLARARHVR